MYVWRLQKPRSSITLAAKPHRRNHRRYPLRRTGNPWPVEPETRREYRSSANPATPTVANAGSLTVANVWPAGGYRFAAATTLWGATIRSARRLACSKRGPVESDHALGSHDSFGPSPRVFQARAGGERPRSGEPRPVSAPAEPAATTASPCRLSTEPNHERPYCNGQNQSGLFASSCSHREQIA